MDACTCWVRFKEVPGLNAWEWRIRILFDLEKQVGETLAHACSVHKHTLSSIPMAVAAKPSTGSQHEGCIFIAAV